MMFATPPPRYFSTASPVGESQAAHFVQSSLYEFLIDRTHTPNVVNALAQLGSAQREASHDDWDQPGSKALRPYAFRLAFTLLAHLPPGVPVPDVSVEPTGLPAFDWTFGPNRWLVANLDERGFMSFASSLRERGTVPFAGSLPETILRLLGELQHA